MQGQIVCAGKVGLTHGVEAENFVRYIIVQFYQVELTIRKVQRGPLKLHEQAWHPCTRYIRQNS